MKILLDEKQLQQGVLELSLKITDCYGDRPLTIIGVLTGSVVLLADTIRLLKMPMRVGVVQAASYSGDQRGELTINSELMPDIASRDVLLIDDIFDTGHTLARVHELMEEFEPNSVRSAVLLKKTGKQQVEYRPDFAAFEIPDEFVVGYGIDYAQRNRNLPHIGKVRFTGTA